MAPVMTCFDTFFFFLMTPPYMSFSKLLSRKPVTVGFFGCHPSQCPRPQKVDVRAMLSKPLLSLPFLWISNWFVYNYELYKVLQEEQNVYFCDDEINHKLETPLEFKNIPLNQGSRSTAFCWEIRVNVGRAAIVKGCC